MQIGQCEHFSRAEDSSRDDASVSAARIIRLDLSEQEATAVAALFDVAVKAAGLQVAQAALHLTQRLAAAIAAARPVAEG